jgi:hypothetical protein
MNLYAKISTKAEYKYTPTSFSVGYFLVRKTTNVLTVSSMCL